MTRELTVLVAVVSLFGLTFHGKALADGQGTFDFEQFAKLDPDTRYAIVDAALRRRDADLSNFEYEDEEDVQTFPKQGQGRSLEHVHLTLRRLDERLWLEKTWTLEPKVPAREDTFWGSWDGSEWRETGLQGTRWYGTVMDHRPMYITGDSFNHMLGLYRPADKVATSVVDWLESAHKRLADSKSHRETLDISVTERAGAKTVRVSLSSRFLAEWYVFDPDKQFMIVAYERRYDLGPSFNHYSNVVVSADRFGGIFVPTKVAQEASTSAGGGGRSTQEFVLKEFRPGAVQAKDLEFKFRPGTEVIDEVRNKAYRVRQDGGEEPIAFFDVNTGRLVKPPAGSSSQADKPAASQPSSPN